MSTEAAIGHEKYVALTTRKRNGDTVTSPVWIASLADGAVGFTTELTSGKVKRMRNFPEVTLQPCSARGVVKEGSSVVQGRATVLEGDACTPVEDAIKAKYGFMVTAIGWLYSARQFVTRKPGAPRAAVHIELADRSN
jgi:PPOX class probable F420-dependent enzyme